MAPAWELASRLVARDDGCGWGWFWNGQQCQKQGGWFWWGRWVVTGIFIVLAILFLLGFMLVSRRRRRRGQPPLYGTGWMGTNHNNKWGQQHPQQPPVQPGFEMNNYGGGGAGYGGYSNPPPYMNNQGTGTTFNPNDGYYAGQQYGVQPPPHSYQPDGFSGPTRDVKS